MYGNHPAARVSPTPQALDALTRDALVEFHKAHYVPDRAVLAVAGDITLAQAKAKAETAFSGVEENRRDDRRPGRRAADHRTRRLPWSCGPAQCRRRLLVGTQSIQRTDPDYDALTVANRTLGGPFGRLFEHLREQKGYTYGANSGFSATRFRGAWNASTDVRTEVTDPALTDLIDEIRQMRDTPISRQGARGHEARYRRRLRADAGKPDVLLNNYIDSYQYKLPADYWDTYPARIEAITAADVQRVAKKYWTAAPAADRRGRGSREVEPALKKLGAVMVYDVDGKVVQ